LTHKYLDNSNAVIPEQLESTALLSKESSGESLSVNDCTNYINCAIS